MFVWNPKMLLVEDVNAGWRKREGGNRKPYQVILILKRKTLQKLKLLSRERTVWTMIA